MEVIHFDNSHEVLKPTTQNIAMSIPAVARQEAIAVVDYNDLFTQELKLWYKTFDILSNRTEFEGYPRLELGYRKYNNPMSNADMAHKYGHYLNMSQAFRQTKLGRKISHIYGGLMARSKYANIACEYNGDNGPVVLTTREQHPEQIAHFDILPEIADAFFDKDSCVTFLYYMQIPKELQWAPGTFIGDEVIRQVEGRLVMFSSTLEHGQIPHALINPKHPYLSERKVLTMQAATNKGGDPIFYT